MTLDLFLPSLPISSLLFFGPYCLLIGYLIFRSGFLPRILGLLMALAGLGWVAFLFPAVAHFSHPLYRGLRHLRGTIADVMAARDGRQCSTMEGTVQRGTKYRRLSPQTVMPGPFARTELIPMHLIQ